MVASDPFFLPAGTKKKQNKKRTLKEEKYTKDDDNDDEATMTDIDDLDLEHRLESEAAESDDDFKKESAQEKRIRLARNYLDDLNRQVEQERNEIDAAQLDRDLVAERLQKDVLETVGRLKYVLADKVCFHTIPDNWTQNSCFFHEDTIHAILINLSLFFYA
jgi:ribosomal RNA-processing protein 9